MKNLIINCLKLYRALVSPILAPRCRFVPSCSQYSIESLQTQGLFKGCLFTIQRLIKCRPGGEFGYDPVKHK